MSTTANRPASAATDVPEFITDLDGGMFERILSQALSETAAAAVDHGKVGKYGCLSLAQPSILEGKA